MNRKNQQPNLRSEKAQSASFLTWVLSGFYLLGWFGFCCLRRANTAHMNFSRGSRQLSRYVSYGILMLWLWPNEEASTTKQMGRPAKL